MTWVSVVWRKIKIALFYQTSPSQNSKSFCGDTLKARRTTLERLSLRWYFHTNPHFQLSRRVAALLWSSYLLENTMVIMKAGWIFLHQYMQVLMSRMMCTWPFVVAYNLFILSPHSFLVPTSLAIVAIDFVLCTHQYYWLFVTPIWCTGRQLKYISSSKTSAQRCYFYRKVCGLWSQGRAKVLVVVIE